MKYPKEYLEEIKSRLKVSTVISKFVAIKKEARNLLACRLLKMKNHLHLQLMMRKVFTTALALESMEIYLIF